MAESITSGPLGIGAIKSPFDYRDKIASASVFGTPSAPAAIPLPSSYHTDMTVLGPVLMQAQTPSCVSHSVALNLKLYWFRKTGKVIDFSPRFLDTLAKRFDGQDRATGGTIPRLVFKLAVQYGCATTATLPNDTNLPTLQYRDDSKLTPAVFAEALLYKIPGYAYVPMDVQSTRQALYLFGVISSLFTIGSEFWLPSWADKDIDPLRTPQDIVGGHQLSPYGYDDMTFDDLQNSWSGDWANGGRAKYGYQAWAPFIHEQWAVAEIPSDVVSFLQALPSAANFHYTWNTNLSQGMPVNDDVKFLQVAFIILGYMQPMPPDEFGVFGPKTSAANLLFQHDNKINPTAASSVGPKTRAALNAKFSV